jgi:thiosulfate/3-mercaptopyruvate sulfurtransferase
MGTLISADALQAQLGAPDLVVVDCRFDLADSAAGERAFAEAHIPAAVYAHLDRDLSDLDCPGQGRHPLPDAGAFSATMRRLGVSDTSFVVAYDGASGAFAARLWWMLRAMGHRRAAVLDGGFEAWQRDGRRVERDIRAPQPGSFEGGFDRSWILDCEAVAEGLADGSLVLIDARGAQRFSGEVEPLDRVAGHIPGALNRPFTDNLRDGRFLSADELAEAYRALIGKRLPGAVAHMCGSGVTACHGVLAMEHAGLVGSRLFAASWSGWISEPSRPVAVGTD